MKRINKKHLTSAILLAMFAALLLMQLVRATPITISIAPVGGTVGTGVFVSGFADTPGGTVNIYFDIDGDALTEPEEFIKSTSAGMEAPYIYSDTIIVPPSAAGTHAVTATDVTAAQSAGADFTVIPQITVSPDSGPIGTVVTVTGTGFARTSTITITFKDADVTPSPTPATNEVGSFTADFPVPPLVKEDYTITATDAAGNSATDVFSLFGITVSIDPTNGPVGTLVAVSGTQATPDGPVTIWWDNVAIDSVTAQEDGTYSYDLTVPPSPAGEHDVKAEDVESTNTAIETFTVEPQIILGVSEGPVDTELTVTGTGFVANAYVDVTFDTNLMVDNSETDSVGGFIATFKIPPSVAGVHTAAANDTEDETISASAQFTVIPKITIDLTEGPIGTEVQVTGTGFAGISTITLTFDGIVVTPDPVPETDEFGSFTASFETPPAPAGDYTVTAIDEDDNQATATFTLWGITLYIDPTSGPVGTIVSVTVTYATPGGPVIIRWDHIDIETITAEPDGTYSYDLTVPASVTGEHTVTVEDVESTNIATQTFTVEQQIILEPKDGLVGDSVTVTGTGFSGVSVVDVYFDIDKDGFPDADERMLDDVPTDEFGSFESAFSVPWVSTAGNYLITAVDGEGVADDATFTVLFVMYTRSDEYFQGDYPSFFIQVVNEAGEQLEGAMVVVEIYDPEGYLQYKGITITIENGTVPYDMQFFNWWIWNYAGTFEPSPLHLSSDALIGTWRWTTTTNGLTVNGSFEVIEPVDLRTLLAKLEQLLEGQDDIAGLIAYYGEKLHLEHDELAGLIGAVSNQLQMNHQELVDLVSEVADKLQLGHEAIIALISEVAESLEMKLDALSTLVSDTADKLKLDHEELANLISQVANKLQIEHTDIIELISNVSEKLQMDHAELAGLVTQVFDELNLKLDDINSEIIGIEAKVDGLYVVIGDLGVKLEDINAQLVEVQGNIATIITDIGTIKTDISNINAKITSVEGRLATIETDIGTIKVDIANINGEITSINGQLATITTSIATIQTDISAINGRLTSIEGNIATIVTDIGTIKTDVSNIKVKIVAVEGRLATIETDIGTIKTDIGTINGKIVAIDGRLATIETDIGLIQTNLDDIEAELEDISGVIAIISTALGRVETKIDNLGAISLEEIKADIATVKSDIGTIKVNVNNINANITSIKGRLVTIETTVGTIQEDIDNINGKIVALEGDTATIQTDIGTIKTNLTSINTKIEVTNGNIATIQTDIGTIKGRLATVEGDVATIETDIGTVKTCTENIEATGESIKSDTGLQPATVGLSLIAAIGAIAAAVMVLRKVYMK